MNNKTKFKRKLKQPIFFFLAWNKMLSLFFFVGKDLRPISIAASVSNRLSRETSVAKAQLLSSARQPHNVACSKAPVARYQGNALVFARGAAENVPRVGARLRPLALEHRKESVARAEAQRTLARSKTQAGTAAQIVAYAIGGFRQKSHSHIKRAKSF